MESECEVSLEEQPIFHWDKFRLDKSAAESISSYDSLSAVVVGSRFIVVGTKLGKLLLIDHSLGLVASERQVFQKPINDISLDDSGEFVACCSQSGSVVICSLFEQQSSKEAWDLEVQLEQPIKSIAISPTYGKSNGQRSVLIADYNRLICVRKAGFLRGTKQVILYDRGDPLTALTWRTSFACFATSQEVRVFDMNGDRQCISLIPRHINTKSHQPPAGTADAATVAGSLPPQIVANPVTKCRILWHSDHKFVVGWELSIKVCCIRDGQGDARSARKFVDVVSMFSLDAFLICGLAPYDEDLVVMAFGLEDLQFLVSPESGGGDKMAQPHIRVIRPLQEDYVDVNHTKLCLRSPLSQLAQFQLHHIAKESRLLIITPNEWYAARPLQFDDKIEWLLKNQFFEKALDAARGAPPQSKFSVHNVAPQYVEHLLSASRPTATVLEKICELAESERSCRHKEVPADGTLWNTLIAQFALQRPADVHLLATVLPTLEETVRETGLPPTAYDAVLRCMFDRGDFETFLKTVSRWPASIYSVEANVTLLQSCVPSAGNESLHNEALATLLKAAGRHQEAVRLFLRMRSARLFALVEEHRLFADVADQVVELCLIDSDQAVRFLVRHLTKFPVERVIQQLSKHQGLQLRYLDSLVDSGVPDATAKHHDTLVELYASQDRERLLPFLKRSQRYDLPKALQTCERLNMVAEKAFLLGRMGDYRKALELIMTKLGDALEAIRFCREHENADPELWFSLQKFAIAGRPDFVAVLLNNLGLHRDPLQLISNIPKDMKIVGLRDSLCHLLQDYRIQVCLHEESLHIFAEDILALIQKLLRLRRNGRAVFHSSLCDCCRLRLVPSAGAATAKPIVLFNCNHVAHQAPECAASGNPSCQFCLNALSRHL